MKVALLGSGKTGGRVAELLESAPTIFSSSNPPTVEKLEGHDVIISFLPGEAFFEYIPMLVETGLPVVTGSTGFEWPSDLQEKLQKLNTRWLYASNFSLGMNLVHQMINTLSKASKLFEDASFNMHEVHHTKKLDAPSGTALSWRDWLGQKVEITHERVGDVVGDHKIILNTANERITLQHEALDRRIFAAGAIWAAKKILNDSSIESGLHNFQDITLKEIL